MHVGLLPASWASARHAAGDLDANNVLPGCLMPLKLCSADVSAAPRQNQPHRSRLETIWSATRAWLATKGGFMVHPAPRAEQPQPELPI